MLTVSAPAKINWSLKVKGRRDDGYHEIESLMQCISLSDTLTFALSDKPSSTITIESNTDIPQEDNLVYKAAILLQKETGTKKGALISLDKDIPMEAGLGGGSSDAAATLKGLCRLWGVDV
ncbi:MAG: 4-(cytidine 5'-diphospho)-2-C-methyl-D-erythritol kinase, partial [Thermodesulfovibrionales bacterium]|nr:4-(cytidine 5'-diphospho)-2-C-methyl-D-erythritol kinase [Thermodesulfovibrionales bacterium]